MVRQPDLYSNWSINTHLPSLHRLDGLDGLDVTGVDSMADMPGNIKDFGRKV